MFNRLQFKHLLVVLLCLYYFLTGSTPTEWQQQSNQVLRDTLNRYHYVNQPIDDNFSKRVFKLFLNKVDPNKHFFTEKQIIELQSHEYKIDNDIRNGSFNFFELCLLKLEKQIELTHSM